MLEAARGLSIPGADQKDRWLWDENAFSVFVNARANPPLTGAFRFK